MVDTMNVAINQMCKALPGNRASMASALGMTMDQFNNRMYRKCNSHFFTIDELQKMEDISGTAYLAEYFANRKGLTLVDISTVEKVDKVDLFDIEMENKATAGKLAIAKQDAAADGVIDPKELKKLSGLFHQKMRGQIHGFLGFLALYGVGVSEQSVDLFISHRKAEAGIQIQAQEL